MVGLIDIKIAEGLGVLEITWLHIDGLLVCGDGLWKFADVLVNIAKAPPDVAVQRLNLQGALIVLFRPFVGAGIFVDHAGHRSHHSEVGITEFSLG